MQPKPTTFAGLVRYLTENPNLELHMPADSLVVRGNCGPVDMSKPARVETRTFVKKISNQLAFLKADGKTSYLTVASANFLTFFDDRFETPCIGNGTLKYYYKSNDVEVKAFRGEEQVYASVFSRNAHPLALTTLVEEWKKDGRRVTVDGKDI